MIIVDTSVWIEYFRGNQPYFDQISELLILNKIVALSPVFGELLQGAKTNNERSILMDFWGNLFKMQEQELFVHAGAESGRKRWMDKGVGLIDSMIIVAARESAFFVWTLDKKMLSLLNREEIFVP